MSGRGRATGRSRPARDAAEGCDARCAGLTLGALAGLLGVAWAPGPGSAEAAAAGPVAHASDGHGWSAPAELAACRRVAAPLVAFPSEGPSTPSGAGAVVWAAPLGSCAAATGPRAPWELSVAAIGPGDVPAPAHTQPLGASRVPALSAVGAGLGRVTVLASAQDRGPAAVRAVVLQGPASAASWSRWLQGRARRRALARAYLGDVATATVRSRAAPGRAFAALQRPGMGPQPLDPPLPGPITALTATMDYRADVLLAWQQNGAIYAHMLRISGRPDPTQRIGPSGPDPQLQAVVSDNDHGMIAWSSTAGPGATRARASTWASRAAGVRFGAPRAARALRRPAAVGRSPGSLALERLSTENVMLAWTVAEHGHYVVRAAPAVFAALAARARSSPTPARRRSSPISLPAAPTRRSRCGAPRRGRRRRPGHEPRELWAARTPHPPSHVVLRSRRRWIAAAGPNVAPAVAVDPARRPRRGGMADGRQRSRRIEYARRTRASPATARARRLAGGAPGGRHALAADRASPRSAGRAALCLLRARWRRRRRERPERPSALERERRRVRARPPTPPTLARRRAGTGAPPRRARPGGRARPPAM